MASPVVAQSSSAPLTSLEHLLEHHGLILVEDRLLVWNPASRCHPRHWSRAQKWLNAGYIFAFEALASAMSTAGTAAADVAQHEFAISRTLAYFAFTALSIIAEALSGLIFPPLSESFGRRPQYLFGAVGCVVGYGITCIPSLPAVFIGRFLAGIAGGIPPSISPGALEDILDDPQSRTWGIFTWATCSNAGLVIGPIISSQLTQTFGWRASFYAGTIAAAVILGVSLFYKESRPNRVLLHKLHLIRKATGREDIMIENPDHVPSLNVLAQETLTRPARLFFTEPIVFMCSVLNAIAFALIYGLTEGLVVVYDSFGFSETEGNLAFIPVLIGILLSVGLRLWDARVAQRRQDKGLPLTPESRLSSFAVSAPLLAIGLWFFGWTIPPKVQVPWIVSMIGLVPIGLAANDFDTVLADYLVASYGTYAASAFAALAWVRSLVSAAFTLFASLMFEGLGNNIAVTILAAIATVFCISPFVLLRYGRKLRERSPFARYSAEMSEANLLSPKSFTSDKSEMSQSTLSRISMPPTMQDV